MIIYDTKRWGDTFLKILISFKRANNYRRLFKFILVAVVYSGTLAFINIEFIEYKFHLDPVFFSLMGLILSLILVFRLNSSYNKWWEGRQQWGSLINNCRTLSGYLNSIIDQGNKETRAYFAAQIANFCYGLKGHLREHIDYTEFDKTDTNYFENLKKAVHVPHKIATLILDKIIRIHKDKEIDDIDKLNLKPRIENMIDIMGACERIKNTPIPFSHSSFIKSSLSIYLLILPFGLINSFMYLTIPITAFMTFALVGIEIISEEIEEPFNTDPNDLPLTYLCGIIRSNVYGILGTDIPQSLKVEHSIDHPNFKVIF